MATPTYSNSSLATVKIISPNKTPFRAIDIPEKNISNPDGVIDRITIHHMAGNLSVETCGYMFQNPAREASANYCIGSDGRIALLVDEAHRSWCSGNANNDYRAVTIEVANDGGAETGWSISTRAMLSLVKLCADIAKRNGIKKLKYTGDETGNVTIHKMFQATVCPGPYIERMLPNIVDSINEVIAPEAVKPTSLKAGDKVVLDTVDLFSTASTTVRTRTITGTYYCWSSEVISGRIRITNTPERVGVAGQVTGFINVSEVTSVNASTSTATPSTSSKKSVDELANEVIAGKWGNGAARVKALTAAGYDAEAVQDKVDEKLGKKAVTSTPAVTNTLKPGSRCYIKSTATKWATGEIIPSWVKTPTLLYVRSTPAGGTVIVSTVASGAITGVAYTKDVVAK